MIRSFVSIGSNFNPTQNIKQVKVLLNKAFEECIFSGIYISKSFGFLGPEFHNLIVSFYTDLSPEALNILLKVMEKKLGRDESQKGFSSRVIDLDLIHYGDLVINNNGLQIPSKDITEYPFILIPLVEIAGDIEHPVLRIPYKKILEGL